MLDEDNKVGEVPEDPQAQVDVDPWAAAFAALEPKAEEPSEGDGGAGEGQPAGLAEAPAEGSDQGAAQTEAPARPVDVAPGDGGGMPAGVDGGTVQPGEEAGEDTFSVDEQEIQQQIQELKQGLEERAIQETANLFVQKNIRHDAQGRLGATINDPDIYKKNEDGVPTFYNPDTGKPFTGDNPRAQARQWVQDYNEELKETFNKVVGQRMQQMQEQVKPVQELLEFAPKFQKLDPVRQRMMESIIEDYEIDDGNGNVIGYSCDLERVLAQVNKQIAAVRSTAGSTFEQPKPKTSPATDMKTGSGAASTGKPQFKSMAEAMEWEQDRLLEQMKGKKK